MPDLRPYRVANPVPLAHLHGPRLRSMSGASAAPRGRGARARATAARRITGRGGVEAARVVVVGSLRSGSSLLAASLGQHPRLEVWTASDPAREVPKLMERLSGVRMIHVVRDVSEVVHSLVGGALSEQDPTRHTIASASRHWGRTVRACVAAEAAHGPGGVTRVRSADLMRDPAGTLRHCLDFLEERPAEECLRPFRGLAGERVTEPPFLAGAEQLIPGPLRHLSEMLLGSLEAPLPAGLLLDPDPDPLDRCASPAAHTKESLLETIRSEARAMLPPDARVLVVSRGDDELLEAVGAVSAHFPQGDDGRYAGHHPADCQDAIDRLGALRSAGARHLLFPSTSFWWLRHYRELRRHLERDGNGALSPSGAFVLFDLHRATDAMDGPVPRRGDGAAVTVQC